MRKREKVSAKLFKDTYEEIKKEATKCGMRIDYFFDHLLAIYKKR